MGLNEIVGNSGASWKDAKMAFGRSLRGESVIFQI